MGHQLSTGSAGAPAEQHHFAVPTRHGRPPATPRSARAWTGSLRLETENGKSSGGWVGGATCGKLERRCPVVGRLTAQPFIFKPSGFPLMLACRTVPSGGADS